MWQAAAQPMGYSGELRTLASSTVAATTVSNMCHAMAATAVLLWVTATHQNLAVLKTTLAEKVILQRLFLLA